MGQLGHKIMARSKEDGSSLRNGDSAQCRVDICSVEEGTSRCQQSQSQSWKGFPGNLSLVPLHVVLHKLTQRAWQQQASSTKRMEKHQHL